MKTAFSRAVMAVTACCLDERRGDWSAAMRAEFEIAVSDGKSLSFAMGCLGAALQDMPRREEGRFTLSSYGLALCVIIPMASFQIGCALFGIPYIHPSPELSGPMLDGMNQIYRAAIPSLTLVLLLVGLGHLCLAWAMLERDWNRVMRLGRLAMAAAVTLVILMSVLFLDIYQVGLQAIILSVELTAVMVVAKWHTQLFPVEEPQHSE